MKDNQRRAMFAKMGSKSNVRIKPSVEWVAQDQRPQSVSYARHFNEVEQKSPGKLEKYLRKNYPASTSPLHKKVVNPPIYALEDPEGYGLSPKEALKLWQKGVDSGIVWKLQGWYGREAQSLLDRGLIKYPKKQTVDYYGNPIRTRQ